ncbi:MAG TPA: hypothetical protein VHQ64_05740 [Pyrinomonadaceae bacterium]|nr:hypothetical protein [Pyrinomonadaceae bacterium]
MLPLSHAANEKNAGIEVRGIVLNAEVSGNTIRGRARAALSVIEDPNGAPIATRLVENHHEDFQYLLADVCIGAGASNTQITAPAGQQGHIQDLDKSDFSEQEYTRI